MRTTTNSKLPAPTGRDLFDMLVAMTRERVPPDADIRAYLYHLVRIMRSARFTRELKRRMGEHRA
jgi:hypothetical protein